MIGMFKELVLPYLVYLTVLSAVAAGIVWRAELPLLLYAILAPLPTLWYPTQVIPLGKDTMDLLIISGLIGGWLRSAAPDPEASRRGFIVLFLVVAWLAVWNVTLRYGFALPISGANPVLSLWKNYTIMVLLYVVAFNALAKPQHVRWLVLTCMGVLLFMVWRELAGFAAGSSFSYGKRANGPFWIVGLNANHFGAFIAHYAALALGLYAVDTDRMRRRIYLAAFVLSLYPLFYSYSRGAYAALLVAMVVLGVLRYRFLLVVVAVLAFSWQVVLPESVVDRIQMTEGADGELEESAALRIVVWELAQRLFIENPVFGIGFSGFVWASAHLPLHNTHNYYLQTAAEQGVIGVILLLLLFGKALMSGWRLYRDGVTPFWRGLGLGFIACTFAVMITNVFGDRFSQLALGSYFFILFGAVDRAWAHSRAGWTEMGERIGAPAEAAGPAGGPGAGTRPGSPPQVILPGDYASLTREPPADAPPGARR